MFNSSVPCHCHCRVIIVGTFLEDQIVVKSVNEETSKQALEQEVETQRSMIRHQDKRCKMLELEMEEKITRTKLIYEEKMRG